MNQFAQYIEDVENSVWISASAGTGKTKLLVDRFINLALSGVAPEKILCITFTNATALEMEERISKILDERGISLSKRLRIKTLHSFCQGLVRDASKVDGELEDVEIIDGAEREDLLQNAIVEVIKESAECEYLDRVAHKVRIDNLMEYMNDLRSYFATSEYDMSGTSQSHRIAETLGIGGVNAASLISDLLSIIYAWKDQMEAISKIFLEGNKTECKMGERIVDFLNAKDAHEAARFGRLKEIFLTKQGRGKSEKFIASKKFQSEHGELFEILIEVRDAVHVASEKLENINFHRQTEALLHLCGRIYERFTAEKESKKCLDYDDLIYKAHHVLDKSEGRDAILFDLSMRIDHVLIDEAQDLSRIQWDIVQKITEDYFAGDSGSLRPRTLFVVGDDKQSIYGFRGSHPDIFSEMKSYFYHKIASCEQKMHCIESNNSFRSVASVLELVDEVFCKRPILGVERYFKHNVARKGGVGCAEILPMIECDEEYKNAKKLLAESIGDQIHRRISSGRIAAGDVMVLVRHRDDFMRYLGNALGEHGVDAEIDDGMPIAEHIAVTDLIALGNFCMMPHDDVALVGILKSPICDFSEEEIFEIAYNRGKKSVWNVLLESEKFHETKLFLSNIMHKGRSMRVFDFYSEFIYRADFKKKMIERLGKRAGYYIDAFLETCLVFEKSQKSFSLQKFLFWMQDNKRKMENCFANATNAVRIMTVHRSKGLQAPVVFLADTVDIPRCRKEIYMRDGAPYWTNGINSEFSSILKDEYKTQMMSEYYRLLYVAMTRAEDELYITGCISGKKSTSGECWYNIVASAMRLYKSREEDIAMDRELELV